MIRFDSMSPLLFAIVGRNALHNLDETSEAIQFEPTSPRKGRYG